MKLLEELPPRVSAAAESYRRIPVFAEASPTDRCSVRALDENREFSLNPTRFEFQAELIPLEANPLHLKAQRMQSWFPHENFHAVSLAEFVRRNAIENAMVLPPKLRQNVMAIASLEANWDGESAKPVRPDILAEIVATINRLVQNVDSLRDPILVPTFEGYAQLEWRGLRRSLELEATETEWIAVGTEQEKTDEPVYFEAQIKSSDFRQILLCYRWFVGEQLLWPSR